MSKHNKPLANQTAKHIETSFSQEVVYSGPLPPPAAFQKYNEILPGAADRLLSMAERQSAHRQSLEKSVVDAGCSAQVRGQYLGFAIAMTVVLGGFTLIWNGKDAVGLSAIITSLVSLVGVFLYGRSQQKRELTKKADAFGPRPVTQ